MELTPALSAAALWSSQLIIVLVLLSVRVTMGRRRLRVSLGDGGNREMEILTRSFANAAEYVPMGLAALILLAPLFLVVALTAVQFRYIERKVTY